MQGFMTHENAITWERRRDSRRSRVRGFPGRRGPRRKMFAEGLAVLVEELGVGSLEDPGVLRDVLLAGVDLVALGMDS